MKARPLLAVLGFCFMACGGHTSEGDRSTSGGGARDEIGGASGIVDVVSGAGGNVPRAGTTSDGADAGGASSDSVTCESFDDDADVGVQIDVVNGSSEALYLGSKPDGCEAPALFAVQRESGPMLTKPTSCRTPCDVARVSGPVGCPPPDCPRTLVTRLMPQQGITVTWDGLDYVARFLPEACVQSPEGDEQCIRAQRVEPGTFTFTAEAGTMISCSQDCDDACDPELGGCFVADAVIAGPRRQVSVTVSLGPSYGVHPQSEPGPTEPGAGRQHVRLVFRD